MGGKKIDYTTPMSTVRTFKRAPKYQTKTEKNQDPYKILMFLGGAGRRWPSSI